MPSESMTPRNRFLLGGAILVVLALFALLALITAFWPFQSVVQVIAPFLVLSILASVGLSLILTALLAPTLLRGEARDADTTSVVDSLLAETRRRP